jgi:hypothetical protein
VTARPDSSSCTPPGGFEGFLTTVAEAEAATGRELTPAQLAPIAACFDLELVGPPLAVQDIAVIARAEVPHSRRRAVGRAQAAVR